MSDANSMIINQFRQYVKSFKRGSAVVIHSTDIAEWTGARHVDVRKEIDEAAKSGSDFAFKESSYVAENGSWYPCYHLDVWHAIRFMTPCHELRRKLRDVAEEVRYAS